MGRVPCSLALALCLLLSALGGPLHLALHHGAPREGSAQVLAGGGWTPRGPGGEHDGDVSPACHLCVSLARFLATSPLCPRLSVPALACAPDPPMAAPAITMPFRPYSLRDPPSTV